MLKKIVFLQWTNNYGGLERVTLNLEKHLSKYYEPVVQILKFNKDGLKYNHPLISPYSNKFLYLWYFNSVKKNKNAVYHLNNATIKILILTFLAGANNIIYHFHGTKFKKGFFNKIIWKYFQNKTKIVVNSNYVKKLVESSLKINSKINVIPNLIDSTKFKYIRRNYESRFVVTYVGRFSRGKNIDMIIEVARKILLLDNNIFFELYGNGVEKERIIKLINSNNLQSRVKIFDFVNNISEVYHKANIFIFLSSYESFGNVVAESILSGTPPICLKIPALEDLITENLFFVDELDSSVIVEKLIYMKNNYNSVSQTLQKNYDYLYKYLNNEEIINKLKLIYDGSR